MKGGMLQSVELLLRFLPSTVEKIVFIPGASQIAERMTATGARVVRSPADGWTVASASPLRTVACAAAFRQEIGRLLTADSVLLTNNIASELLSGLGPSPVPAPRIFVNRGNQYRGLSAWALKSSLRTCVRFVATTSYQRDVLMRPLGCPTEKITVIPNGVDATLLRDAKSQPRPYWCRPGAIHVATLGYPSEGKNQALLLRSIARLLPRFPNVVGAVIGSAGSDGDVRYQEKLRALVGELGIEKSIVFVPFVEDKRSLFSGIDVLASTSLREGFGRTIVEAMAAGVPVVALRAGGPETIIRHRATGLLVDTNDAELFSDALRSVLAGGEETAAMVQRAREDCERRFSARSTAAEFMRVFEASAALTEERVAH